VSIAVVFTRAKGAKGVSQQILTEFTRLCSVAHPAQVRRTSSSYSRVASQGLHKLF
jgi:hypothetical protein